MHDDELAILRAIDALDESFAATIALAATLTPAQWALPTACPACPGWTVHDQIAHLAGIEAHLLGRPRASVALPPLPHVVDDIDREIEGDVEARRAVPDAALLDELREVSGTRLAQLRAAPPAPGERLPFLGGATLKARAALTIRVLDVWTHGEDIRRAVGAAPDLASTAAALTVEQLLRGFPSVVDKAGVPDGAVVRLELDGPDPRVETVAVGTEPTAAPTLTLAMDLATFTALGAGRVPPTQAEVAVTGDPALAAAVLAAMVLTP